MVTGAVVEAVADRQKDAFMAEKKRARERGPDQDVPEELEILDSGLWGWSRHPNYFGDSLFWDGAWVAAAASAPGAWTFPAPAAMSWFLILATGARRTEKRMEDRPGYRDYQERVAFFFPRPPR
jgi:steroid 5-alpha reductase family enzyme